MLVDALGNTSGLSYDNLDHVLQTVNALGGLTAFTYDAVGNLKTVTDAKSNQTSYGYDNRNRLTSRTDALTKADAYGYDANGNLTSHTDRNGAVTAYTYDALNRRTFAGFGKTVKGHSTSYSAGTITYTWDIGNRLTSALDSVAGNITRGYDGLNHVLSEQTPQGTVGYTYLTASGETSGLRSKMTVAGQTAVGYTWDNANRLTGITQGSQSVGLNYDNANRRMCLTLPNGVVASYGYDNDSRVTSLAYGTGGSCSSPPSNLGNLTYSYDASGRRTAVAGSLAAVTLPANVAGETSTTYNADNAQSKFNGTSLSYDANGNLLTDGTHTYTWDARNHVTAIAGGTTASFVYDAFGRRMNKTISGTTTQFLYDRLNPVQELNSTNEVVANLMTGLGIDEYFARTASSTTSTFLGDALGSTIGLATANNGPIATSYTYQPFGATTPGGSANGNSYEFTGRENDTTGLYFYRARYYSPAFQRFIAQDPIGFAGGDANLYGYASNNPSNLRDPFGLWVVGVGLNGGVGSVGGGGSWTSEIVFDGEGNLGIATTTCAGGMATAGSVGGGGAVSVNPNLPNISGLGGPSLEVGTAFPAGEGLGAGFSFTFQNNNCGKVGGNFYLGGAADVPPGLPINLAGMGCHTTVRPMNWTITGPSGGGVPSFSPVP